MCAIYQFFALRVLKVFSIRMIILSSRRDFTQLFVKSYASPDSLTSCHFIYFLFTQKMKKKLFVDYFCISLLFILPLRCVHSNKLMKKGGGIRPFETLATSVFGIGAKSNLLYSRKDKLISFPQTFIHIFIYFLSLFTY